ncbi:hypothetical protein BC567DRAFT_99216 [Phyllosticta citribraziliensis]
MTARPTFPTTQTDRRPGNSSSSRRTDAFSRPRKTKQRAEMRMDMVQGWPIRSDQSQQAAFPQNRRPSCLADVQSSPPRTLRALALPINGDLGRSRMRVKARMVGMCGVGRCLLRRRTAEPQAGLGVRRALRDSQAADCNAGAWGRLRRA